MSELSGDVSVAYISANHSAVGGTKNEPAEDSKRRWRLKLLPKTFANWKEGANLSLLQNYKLNLS